MSQIAIVMSRDKFRGEGGVGCSLGIHRPVQSSTVQISDKIGCPFWGTTFFSPSRDLRARRKEFNQYKIPPKGYSVGNGTD
jgi:hypothetical protein